MSPHPSPDASWTFSPGVIIALVCYLGIYLVRWRQCRVDDEPHPPSVWRLLSFCGGILVIAIALISPVDKLGEQILAMHMVQHVLLLDIAPILIILGFTRVLLRPVTRRIHVIERRAGILAHPVFAAVLYAGGMIFWHVPFFYDAAASHSGIHVLEHLTFSFIGFLYWWHLLSPIRSRMRLGGMAPIAYMLSTKVVVGFLGIALTFAPSALYGFYTNLPQYWGLTPTSDQAVAGLIMALEQSLVMGVALVILFVSMLNESERQDQRAERFGTV